MGRYFKHIVILMMTGAVLLLTVSTVLAAFPGQGDYNGSFVINTENAVASDTTVISNAINPPTATDDMYDTQYNAQLMIAAPGVLANDTETQAVAGSGATSQGGSYVLNMDGSFTYTPESGDFLVNDTFMYEVVTGDVDNRTATVTISIVNTPPEAVADNYVARSGFTLSINDLNGVLANDSDYDRDQGLNFPGGFLNAEEIIDGTTDQNGTFDLNTNGSFDYTSDNGFEGTDTIIYTISDGIDEASATVSFTVQILDVIPDNYSASYETTLNVSAGLGVLANDNGVTSLTPIVAGSTTLGGTIDLNADGSFVYTPPADTFNTDDTFQYMASNGTFSDSATVTINIQNDAPVANPDSYDTLLNTQLVINAANGVLANDTDIQADDGVGNPLTVTPIVAGATTQGGTVSLAADGSFTYDPLAAFSGTDTFTYDVSDGIETVQGTVTINVSDNLAPVANDDAYMATVGLTLDVDALTGVLANDTDNETDPLTAVLDMNVSQGTLNLNSDGSFSYTPSAEAFGTDTFTYFANDGNNNSNNAATVTITIQQQQGVVPRIYPANEQTLNNVNYEGPNFRFVHIEGVEWYQIWVGTDATNNYQSTYHFEWYPATNDAPFADGGGICDTVTDVCTVPYDIWLPNDGYSWWMTYWTTGDTTTDINNRWGESTFAVNFDPPGNAVVYTNPIDGNIGAAPMTITWNRDTNALWYHLWIGTDDYTTQLYFDWVDATNACNATTCSLNVSDLTFAPGDYEIWTEVWGPNAYVTWTTVNGGNPSTFTVTP